MCIWHRVSSEEEEKETLCGWRKTMALSLFLAALCAPPPTQLLPPLFICVTNNMMPDARLLCL